MPADRSLDRAVMKLYGDVPLPDRLHIWLRLRSCPFEAVAAHVTADGHVLDVGCGHGAFAMYLGLSSPARSVVGIDVDARKIAIAEKARRGLRDPDAVTLRVATPDEPLSGSFDTVVIVDVLYLLSPDRQRRVLAQAAAVLKPGGRLVVKETALTPSWKYRLTALQEDAMVRVLRVTKGDRRSFAPPEQIVGSMRDAGLEVVEIPLARGHVHPHHLMVGTASGR